MSGVVEGGVVPGLLAEVPAEAVVRVCLANHVVELAVQVQCLDQVGVGTGALAHPAAGPA